MTTRRQFLNRAVATGIATSVCKSVADTSEAAGHRDLSRDIKTVQTVLGSLAASQLGVTLTHEHVSDAPGVLDRWPSAWGGKPGLIERAVEQLRSLKAAGIRTVVDLTTYDVGRDIRFLEEVSRKSGVHMVASTGQRFFPPMTPQVSMPSSTIAGLAEYFIGEVDRGIDNTGIKAAVVKVGINAGRPTSLEEMGLRAAARASKATGVPIRIHSHAARRAGESVAVMLEDEGVNPARVSFDHSDDSGDMDYLLGVAGRGYFLSMDHVHRGLRKDVEPSFERRVECIKALVDAGFTRQLLISSDSEFGGSLLPGEVREWRENLDPPEGMLFSVRTLLPRLRELGVSSEQIDVMTVANPGMFFGRSADATCQAGSSKFASQA